MVSDHPTKPTTVPFGTDLYSVRDGRRISELSLPDRLRAMASLMHAGSSAWGSRGEAAWLEEAADEVVLDHYVALYEWAYTSDRYDGDLAEDDARLAAMRAEVLRRMGCPTQPNMSAPTDTPALLAAALADTESGSYVHQPVLGRHQRQAAALFTRLSALGWRLLIDLSRDDDHAPC